MTPNEKKLEPQVLPIQRTVFDLDSFEDITLKKEVTFTPIQSTQEALQRLNHNAEKFLEVINRGLRAEAQQSAIKDPNIPWLTESEDGNLTPFAGTPADSATVNALVLTLAKSVFGYNKDMTADEKRDAKDSARDMIKNTEKIKNGLRKQAAASLSKSE